MWLFQPITSASAQLLSSGGSGGVAASIGGIVMASIASVKGITLSLLYSIGKVLFGSSGPSLEYLAFTSVVNLTESPTNTYTRTSSGNGSAKATKSLAASTNGYIQYEVNSSTSWNAGIGFSANGSQSPDYAFDYLNYLDGGTGTYKTYDTTDGYVDSGVTAVTGDLLKIERTGSTFVASYYRGGSWTTLKTFTPTSSAKQYIYLTVIDVGGTQRVINPQGYNVT